MWSGGRGAAPGGGWMLLLLLFVLWCVVGSAPTMAHSLLQLEQQQTHHHSIRRPTHDESTTTTRRLDTTSTTTGLDSKKMNGNASIRSQHCFSISTEINGSVVWNPHNQTTNNNNTNIHMTRLDKQAWSTHVQQGQIQGQTSVIVFEVCRAENDCFEEVVNMQDFVSSLMRQSTETNREYCTACQESLDYCFLDAASSRTTGTHPNGTTRGRYQRRTVSHVPERWEYVECSECEARKCFDHVPTTRDTETTSTEQEMEDRVLDWMQDMVTCQPLPESLGTTARTWLGHALYAGFICNQEGTGVELGLFVDPDCSVYTSVLSFSSPVLGNHDSSPRMQEEQQQQQEPSDTNPWRLPALQSQALVTHPFLQPLSCGEIQYTSLDDNSTPMTAAGPKDSPTTMTNVQDTKLNSYCQVLLEKSLSLDHCPPTSNESTTANWDDDDTVPGYLFSTAQAKDLAHVCHVVAHEYPSTTNEAHSDYDLWHVYQETDGYGTGSGRLYDYNSQTGDGTNGQSTTSRSRGGKFPIRARGLEIIAVVIVGLVLVLSCREHLKPSSLTHGRKGPNRLLLWFHRRCGSLPPRQQQQHEYWK